MRKIKKCWRAFVSLILIALSKCIKRNNKCLAFGSWKGDLYIDNSRYLFEKALSMYDDSYRFIWVGSNNVLKNVLPSDQRIIFCRKNSIYSLFKLIRCKYMFCSQMHFEDLSNYNVFVGAVVTYLHHGCPVKKWGDDAISGARDLENILDKLTGRRINFDYFICSSEAHYLTNLTALKSWGCNKNNNLRTGTPRNDFLINAFINDCGNNFKNYYAQLLCFPSTKKVILYVPTFRRSGVKNESLVYRNIEEKRKLHLLLSEYDCVLIEKAHYAGDFETQVGCEEFDDIISCPKTVNLQEMLVFTDCLISDYSGALLDFSLVDSPIVHYIYDFDYYRDIDSGLYYDFDDFQAGYAARNFEELLSALRMSLEKPEDTHNYRIAVRNKFMSYENGNASTKILNIVIGERD